MDVLDSRSDVAAMARGTVYASWVGGGRELKLPAVCNTMSYGAADAIAAAYGGDLSLVPSRIGFLFCDSGSEPGEISGRGMKWDDIEVSDDSVGFLVCGFSYAPTVLRPDGGDDAGLYRGNSVVFHSVTRSDDDGDYPLGGMKLKDGAIMRQVFLIGGYGGCRSRKGVILAGTSLRGSGGTYRAKPSGYELAVDWKVEFL